MLCLFSLILVAVVVCFFMCWVPFHVQRLLFIYGKTLPHYQELNSWVFYITGLFYYFSPTLNPILYNAMSRKYRNAFRETLFGIRQAKRLSRYSSSRGSRRETCIKVPKGDVWGSRRSQQRSVLFHKLAVKADKKATSPTACDITHEPLKQSSSCAV